LELELAKSRAQVVEIKEKNVELEKAMAVKFDVMVKDKKLLEKQVVSLGKEIDKKVWDLWF
jgi:hypothetical protein